MAWTSLSSRINQLPLIICGPILRRVEKDNVTVWIAFKERVIDLDLNIYTSSGAYHFSGTLSESFKVGSNLHIAVVTASTESKFLDANTIYKYDVFFALPSDPSNQLRLRSEGVLSMDSSVENRLSTICFGDDVNIHSLPSFVSPAYNLNDLRVLHGSCRKSHGGNDIYEGDSLLAAYKIINENINDPSLRPNFLFLAGDQIYSDDVSHVLLYVLRDAGNTLMGNTLTNGNWNRNVWNEELPGYTWSALKPNERLSAVKAAKFTGDPNQSSHIMYLEEFFSMYLFVWSDVLWVKKQNDFPLFTDVFPGIPFTKKPKFSKKEEFTELFNSYWGQKQNVRNFYNSLKYVRKVLANVSTLMMFDDHEVTDDFFINYGWTKRVLDNSLGSRIVQNGITAFCLFQHWGNAPGHSKYNLSNSNSLINNIKALLLSDGENSSDWNTLKSAILPSLQLINETTFSRNYHLIGGPEWHFCIEYYDKYKFLFTNGRTRRFFPVYKMATGEHSGEGAGLLSASAIDTQITGNSTNPNHVFFLITGTPFLGISLVEFGQNILRFGGGSSKADYEAWSINENTYVKVLEELTFHKNVIVLAGDVHYAFSCSAELLNVTTNQNSVIAQLNSSAQKNYPESTQTKRIQNLYGNSNIVIPKTAINYPVGTHLVRLSPDRLYNLPYTSSLFTNSNTKIKGLLKIHSDGRPDSDRLELISSPIVRDYFFSPAPTMVGRKVNYAHGYTNRFKDWDNNKSKVVNMHNLGDVSFNQIYSQFNVIHNIWYNPDRYGVLSGLQPLTKHIISLVI